MAINTSACTFILVNDIGIRGITGSFTNCSYPYFLLLIEVHTNCSFTCWPLLLTWHEVHANSGFPPQLFLLIWHAVHANCSFACCPLLNTWYILWEILKLFLYLSSYSVHILIMVVEYNFYKIDQVCLPPSKCLSNVCKTNSYHTIIKRWIWRSKNNVSYLELEIK